VVAWGGRGEVQVTAVYAECPGSLFLPTPLSVTIKTSNQARRSNGDKVRDTHKLVVSVEKTVQGLRFREELFQLALRLGFKVLGRAPAFRAG
jgi:hypothetical protein